MATRYFGGDNLAAIGTISAVAVVLTGALTAASIAFSPGNFNAKALLFAGDTGVVTSTPSLTYTTSTNTLHVVNANCSGSCTGFGGTSATPTLQIVTNAGATTTNQMYINGEAVAVISTSSPLGETLMVNTGPNSVGISNYYAGAAGELNLDSISPNAGATAAVHAGAGNVSTGTHSYEFTFADGGGESVVGGTSNSVTILNNSVSGTVGLSNMPLSDSGNPFALTNVYRDKNGDGVYKYVLSTSSTSVLDDVSDAGLLNINPPVFDSTAFVRLDGGTTRISSAQAVFKSTDVLALHVDGLNGETNSGLQVSQQSSTTGEFMNFDGTSCDGTAVSTCYGVDILSDAQLNPNTVGTYVGFNYKNGASLSQIGVITSTGAIFDFSPTTTFSDQALYAGPSTFDGMKIIGPGGAAQSGGFITQSMASLHIAALPTVEPSELSTNESVGLKIDSPAVNVGGNLGNIIGIEVYPTGAASGSSDGLSENWGLAILNPSNGVPLDLGISSPIQDTVASVFLSAISYNSDTTGTIPLGSTLLINGAPTTTGTKTTYGARYSLYVSADTSRFDGPVSIGGSFAPSTTNIGDIGISGLAFRNVYASGTQVVFSGLPANSVTDNFVCITTTGTLRTEAGSCTVSSIRFKEHVSSMSSDDMMSEARKLRSVEFDYTSENGSHGNLNTPHDEGFIAEEVASIDPYLVGWEKASDSDLAKINELYPGVARQMQDGAWYIPHNVDYSKVSVVLSGAIQNLDSRLITVENRVGLLERLVNWLKGLFKK